MALTPPRPDDPLVRFERRLAALERRLPAVTASEVTTASRSLQEGEYARVLPPTAGLTLALPEARSVNRGAFVWVSVEGSSGTVTLVAVSGLVQGASSVALTTVGLYCLVSDGVAGWWLTTTDLAALAGAGLTYSGGVLAVQGSTSITITSDQVQRAALTGEATASANSNAMTVTRSTDYATSPWTGNHAFEAELLLGGAQDESGSGAINVTLGAVVRLLFSHATGNHTVGTVSGCADGRLLVVEFVGTGTHTITHDASSANAFACPGNVDLAITGRGGYIAVGRQGTNANWKIIATTN